MAKVGDQAVIHADGCLPVPVTVTKVNDAGEVTRVRQSGPWLTVDTAKVKVERPGFYEPDEWPETGWPGGIILVHTGTPR